jgi:hypothetical protein
MDRTSALLNQVWRAEQRLGCADLKLLWSFFKGKLCSAYFGSLLCAMLFYYVFLFIALFIQLALQSFCDG